jgi:ribose transport system ATP-binding protein
MENIALGAEPRAWGFVRGGTMREAAVAVLRELGHGDIDPRTPAGLLSPAAQQLVEIGRALASGCRVLVLDEPTSSLTQADVQRLFGILRRLKAGGHAIVYISHFLEEVQTISDRFVVLRDGRVAGSGETATTPAPAMVELMVGRTVDDMYPRSARRTGDAALELTDVVPGNATLTLRRGEVVGIAGLLGAGRTRLMRTIFGLEPVRSGRVRLGTFEGAAAPASRWQQGVGFVSEDRGAEGLALDMSIADNLTLSKLEGLGPGPFLSSSSQSDAAALWIQQIDVKCVGPGQPIGRLSGGNQQKVAIARLLYHDVDVLLLDEPTRGIDVASKAQIYRLVDAVVSDPERPRAALVVSSYLPELLGICDRIAVMTRGRLGPARPVSEWTEHALLMAASGVQDSTSESGRAS